MIRSRLLSQATVLLAWALGLTWSTTVLRAQSVSTQPAAQSRQVRVVTEIAPLSGAKKAEEKDLTAYLLVYFKDETHSIYFATSEDGYTFTDVNSGQPVLLGQDVAEQKGVRDPHLMRTPDGGFYLSMTDLHIYAQRKGLRSTQWERPQEKYRWGNNRALVLMKSFDLVHWTHSIVRVDKAFPAEFGDIGCAWAPETIFDVEKGKPMVYFTMRIGNGRDSLVYSYTDDAFTRLETAPQKLFAHPDEKVNAIDGDITRVGDPYHLFYKSDDRPGGLRHAASDKINAGYVYDPEKVDPENVSCEAPNVWKRNGTQTYVLMYDVFGAKPNNMGFCETTDFKTYKNLGRLNDPGGVMKTTNFERPKHGAVVSITAEELQRLQKFFSDGGR